MPNSFIQTSIVKKELYQSPLPSKDDGCTATVLQMTYRTATSDTADALTFICTRAPFCKLPQCRLKSVQ